MNKTPDLKIVVYLIMAITKIKPVKGALKRALDYIQNPDKTDEKMLVSSFGCAYETAYEEFEHTLSKARQQGNNLAHVSGIIKYSKNGH